MRNVVLVHGGFHGGWCWARVAHLLRGMGCNVFTPSLTGVGDRLHLASPSVGVKTHVQDITNLIESEELEEVVLCGHSYGGMVITGVADSMPARLRHLVYLDAPVPLPGQSNVDILGGPDQGVPKIFRDSAMAFDGVSVPPTGFTAELFGVNDPADAAWVERRLTPHPLKCFEEVMLLENGGFDQVKSKTYVRAEQFPFEYGPAMVARYENDPSWTVISKDLGHDLMIIAPELVASVLTEDPH